MTQLELNYEEIIQAGELVALVQKNTRNLLREHTDLDDITIQRVSLAITDGEKVVLKQTSDYRDLLTEMNLLNSSTKHLNGIDEGIIEIARPIIGDDLTFGVSFNAMSADGNKSRGIYKRTRSIAPANELTIFVKRRMHWISSEKYKRPQSEASHLNTIVIYNPAK